MRCLTAQITACYALNVVLALLSVDTIPTTRKKRPFVDLDKKMTVISFPLERLCSINAQITAFLVQNIEHAV
jgi:hypothetical protein